MQHQHCFLAYILSHGTQSAIDWHQLHRSAHSYLSVQLALTLSHCLYGADKVLARSGSQSQLNGCINDVHNVHRWLASQGFPQDPNSLVILTDDRPEPQFRLPCTCNLSGAVTVSFATACYAGLSSILTFSSCTCIKLQAHSGQHAQCNEVARWRHTGGRLPILSLLRCKALASAYCHCITCSTNLL